MIIKAELAERILLLETELYELKEDVRLLERDLEELEELYGQLPEEN
jgi:hypothetical protein